MSKTGDPPPYSANPPYPPNPQYPQNPPYPPYPPMNQPQATVVLGAPSYGPEPQQTVCPYCHAQIRTSVVTEATTKTHLIALGLCLLFCWPCICVPYCMDSCQNRNHYCPSCKAFLGTYAS